MFSMLSILIMALPIGGCDVHLLKFNLGLRAQDLGLGFPKRWMDRWMDGWMGRRAAPSIASCRNLCLRCSKVPEQVGSRDSGHYESSSTCSKPTWGSALKGY